MMMDAKFAEQRVRQHVGADNDVVRCITPPAGLYLVRPEDECFFEVIPKCPMRVGGTRIVTVNKITGAVREAGCVGE